MVNRNGYKEPIKWSVRQSAFKKEKKKHSRMHRYTQVLFPGDLFTNVDQIWMSFRTKPESMTTLIIKLLIKWDHAPPPTPHHTTPHLPQLVTWYMSLVKGLYSKRKTNIEVKPLQTQPYTITFSHRAKITRLGLASRWFVRDGKTTMLGAEIVDIVERKRKERASFKKVNLHYE